MSNFTWDKWNYDGGGEAFIIRKSLCPDRESVPQWIIENDNLHPDCLNPVLGEHLSAGDVKDGWCKWQVRTDWENGDGEPKGGYVVEDYEPHTKRLDGKRKAGWFPVWIVRVGEWY